MKQEAFVAGVISLVIGLLIYVATCAIDAQRRNANQNCLIDQFYKKVRSGDTSCFQMQATKRFAHWNAQEFLNYQQSYAKAYVGVERMIGVGVYLASFNIEQRKHTMIFSIKKGKLLLGEFEPQ